MFKKFLNWLYVILWLGVIFYFSSQPELKSELEPFWDFVFRKIAHISEFFVLTYLLFNALKQHQFSFSKILIFSASLSVIYAIFDEYHQLFVFGRTGTPGDVLIDTLGIIIAIILLRLYNKNYSTI